MQHTIASLQSMYKKGFTVVELIIVITVIGILAGITIVAFNGIAGRANDNAVISDANKIESLQTDYALKNENGGKNWFSGDGIDIDLQFQPTGSNLIDVVANDSDFCIRSFNPASNSYKTLYTAYEIESGPGSCGILLPSQAAVDADVNLVSDGWAAISTGDDYTCGLSADKRSYCWGNGPSGQMGTSLSGGTSNQLNPLPVLTNGPTNGVQMRYVNASTASSCSVSVTNVAYCWGSDLYGERGDGIVNDGLPQIGPQLVQTSGALSGKTIKQLNANAYGRHTCVIASDDLPYCWGYNYYGQLGYGAYMGTGHSGSPVAISTSGAMGGQTVKDISAGYTHNCVIAQDNYAYCWGYNNQGQLGNGSTGSVTNPAVAVSRTGMLSGKTVQRLAAGYLHSCALASDGLAYCWGLNSSGQLGNNSTTASSSPVAVNTSGVLAGKTILQLSGGYNHMCAVASDHQVYCWGAGTSGQLGNGASSNSLVPVAVSTAGVLNGKIIKAVSAGDTHTCAVATDNNAYCWGTNTFGQFGNGTQTSSSTPVLVNRP